MTQSLCLRARALGTMFLMIVVLSACATTKPTIVISSPPSGSQFVEGDEIKVQSTATDSAGVDRVELLVDGIPVRTDPSPNPQVSFTVVQTWKATQGAHVISVRAYNKTGGVSDMAAISINVAPTIAQANTPTAVLPVPPTNPPPPPPPGVTPTATSTAAPSGTCVNNAGFVTDVTIPDGMTIAAGQPFNKTWRMTNNGTCTWTNYEFVFVSGNAMTPGTVVAVPNLAPGGTVDITVPMTAPTTPGSYTGNWRMRSNTGVTFGTTVRVVINVPGAVVPPTNTPTSVPSGCSGTPVIASFTASSTTITAGASTTLQWGAVTNADAVEIDHGIGGVATPGSQTVSPATTTTYTMTARCGTTTAVRTVTITVMPIITILPPPVMVVYDLVDKANLASWSSAAGSLTFGGPDTDTRGFAMWRNNFKLNDNTTPARVLETHPQWVANGRISGTFLDIYNSGYTVQASDKISGKVGFINGGSAGNVTFKVMIRPQGGPNTWIVTIPLAYAEGAKSFSQSLAAYVGKRADFIIEVDAGASASQDWAVWESLRIIRGGP